MKKGKGQREEDSKESVGPIEPGSTLHRLLTLIGWRIAAEAASPTRDSNDVIRGQPKKSKTKNS